MTTYPVHVEARLDPGLSRWLWIVKWLLAIPHYVVLVFLWMAFFVLSVVAFFAILFTGRYPRSIFEFNVGVLRWTWRVTFYSYGVLGTDRYPPFTLHDVADYPAHLEVDYPERLSRGLVLVKWWLLAIPHYVVVALLVGGTGYSISGDTDGPAVSGSGLIGVLVLIAAVILLFTGRYPQQLFDLILGLNRWVLRVAGYASLMTDRYPPFSLDQGGAEESDDEQGGPRGPRTAMDPSTTAHATPEPVSPPVRRPSGWTAGRTISVVAGAGLAMVALAAGIAWTAMIAADLGARDDEGFLMSPTQRMTTSTYAIASTPVEIQADAPFVLLPEALIGDAKVTVVAQGGEDVFLGIGPTSQVDAYLRNTEHASVIYLRHGDAVLRTIDGSAPILTPDEMTFWTAQSSGPGRQQVTWPVELGDWTAVVMNSETTRGVDVRTTAGAEVPALPWLMGILLTLSAMSLVVSIILIAVPLRAVSRETTSS